MIRTIFLLLLLIFLSEPVFGEDGEVGSTSTGSSNISIVIEPRLNPTVSPDGNLTFDTNLNLEEFDTQVTYQGDTKIIVYIPK